MSDFVTWRCLSSCCKLKLLSFLKIILSNNFSIAWNWIVYLANKMSYNLDPRVLEITLQAKENPIQVWWSFLTPPSHEDERCYVSKIPSFLFQRFISISFISVNWLTSFWRFLRFFCSNVLLQKPLKTKCFQVLTSSITFFVLLKFIKLIAAICLHLLHYCRRPYTI